MRFLAVTVLLTFFAIPAAAQKPKPRPPASKPKPASAQKKLNEQAEWAKAVAITEPTPRIDALKKFIKNFPRSTRLAEATTLLVTAEYGHGNDKLVAGEIDAAADLYTAAVTDAPKPVPDAMWNEQLSRIAPNLYFRGGRGEALDITKLLEEKAAASAPQLLNIATFYLSIENGTEAKRVAEAAIKLDANSSAAHQTLGLAHRMDFQLEESAGAFAKALELEPDSVTARRGLAEMKRSLGKADEAVALYREMLAKDGANVPAQTGLILSLFEAGNRTDAEAEMAKSLEANGGNVILLAGAAYWYAAHAEPEKAVDLAQKAIAADSRFIWSHIALARGLLAQKKPVEAEKALLSARRYGNFPTLEYEIASARLAAGLYREAAEELARSFAVKDGNVHTKLGGRVASESRYFTELVGFERRASIFAPTAADNAENAAQLRALLELKQELDASTPNADNVSKLIDEFVRGDDKMKVHRQLFAASQLLDKKVALEKVLEITKAAPQSLDAGLDISDASTAVLASELYESRRIAAARDDYVSVPLVPRATLSSVMRGRIEEITGWAFYQMDSPLRAAVHLRRAVGVLPADSAYWRSSLWRLGTVLMVSGKDAEALDAFIKSYKAGTPDAVQYNAIAAVYKRVNGSTDGLDAQIGPNPAAEHVAQKTEPTPAEQKAESTPAPQELLPAAVPAALPTPAVEVPIATPTVEAAAASPTPIIEVPTPSPTPTLEAAASPVVEVPTPSSTPMIEVSTPSPTPTPEPSPARTVEVPSQTPSDLIVAPAMVPIATPAVPESTPSVIETIEPSPTPSPTPEASATETESVAPSPTPTPSQLPEPTPSPSASPSIDPSPMPTPNETVGNNQLFPPVVITIPAPAKAKPSTAPDRSTSKPVDRPPNSSPAEQAPENVEEAKPNPSPIPEEQLAETAPSEVRPRFVGNKPEVRPCRLTVSEATVTLQTGGGDVAVVVGRTDDNELDGLTAVSTSPENVSVKRQIIEGMRTRALFVLHPGDKAGVYQVRFEVPCGMREIVVRVR